MKKKFLALVLTLAMVLSLVPATALATNGTQEGNNQGPVEVTGSNNDQNLTMKKTVIPNTDGTYTVHLESYATGEVTDTTTTKSSDIVLLLDVSGSMSNPYATKETYSPYNGYNNRELKSYSTTHWGLWYKTDANIYVPVFVNKESKYGYNNDKYTYSYTNDEGKVIIEESIGGFTQPNTQFYYKTDATKMDVLKEAVNAFIDDVAEKSPTSQISIVKFAGEKTDRIGNNTYSGGENYTQIVTKLTKVGDGGADQLKQAVSQLTAAGATSSDYGLQKAQKALENATKDKVVVLFTDGEPNHFNGFDYNVATTAVNTAKTLKQGKTTIYTVGVFENTTNDINQYMSSLSSNYPDASATVTGNGWKVTNGGSKVGEHYINAENAADLIKAFQTISSEVSSTNLDGSAVVVDKVPSNFTAPANDGDVTLKVANYKADGTFGTETAAPSTIHASVNEDGTVSVTGFDFSKNWCALDGDKPHGQKLIIEFTISRTNYGGTQPTNAGAYIKAKANDEKQIIKLNDPTVPVTISLGSKQELLKNPEVTDEKPYDGTGLAILPKIAEKANALATGTDNAYVNMDLTVTVGQTTYTYKILPGETTGSWYEGDSEEPMTPDQIAAVKTPKDVNRDQESKEVKPYTYKFDLKLSDATPNGAAPAEYKNNTASFKIIPKAVTVKANDQQVQKGTDPNSIPYTATMNGLVNGEQESLISHTINCDGYTVDTAVGSELTITATGDTEQGNYTVTYKPGKLTVVAAPVTTGTLEVTKKVEGISLNQLPQDFKIIVKDESDATTSTLTKETVTTTGNDTLTWTMNLPAGTYTVSEEKADVTGYDCTATYRATNGAIIIVNRDASVVQNQPATDAQASQKVTVTENRTSTMTVTNKYTKQQEVVPTPDTSKPDVNKTATALANDKTDVTLSVGGKSAKENVAVMFLLDKSTSMGTRQEAAKMLQHLKGLTNTNIIYDVVIFSGTASSTGWKNISDDATYTDTEENFANKEPSSGTNMPAGIDQALKDMNTLKSESEYSSYSENTYLVTISDGITYIWDEDGTTKTVPVAEKQAGVDPKVSKTVDTWDIMYGPGVSLEDVYTDFASFLTSIPQKMEQTKESGYVCDYTTSNPKSYITVENTDKFSETNKPNQYACAPEFSVYYSATKYQKLVKPFTKSFALPMPELKEDGTEKTTNWEYYPWGRELMLYLQSKSSNSGQGVVHDADAATIFAGIRNEILYEIKSGSITDVIGADFSLTDQTLTKDTFTLKVKGEKVAANEPSGNEITFGERDESTGKYPYVLTYYKGTATKNADNTYTITSGEKIYKYTPCDKTGEVNGSVSDEFFVLEMNVPVVSLDLTYNLSLTSKRTAAGTYEVPTNESATLAYKSANQNSGTVDFNEPTVSYTVKGSSGGHGGNGGGTVTIPDDVPTGLNGKDHYAYVVGYPDGMVYPQKNITRAEVATIFFRLLTDETREANMTKSNSYNDMKDGAWYTCAVSTLSKMGIIKGYEDGSFKPDASISRAEFAAIAARFDPDGDKTPATFSDVSSHWAKDEISIAANHGWIKGYEDGSFKPDQKITRAETMTLVNRVLKRLPETKDDLHKDMKTWPDNQNESAWFYLAVQEATNSHYQKLKKDGTHETWESMRETRDWAALEK